MPPHNDLQAFHEVLRCSTRVLALCGSGLAAASGLPTSGDAGGYWRNYRTANLITKQAFSVDPGIVWLYFAFRRHNCLKAEPNAAHWALAALAKKNKEFLCLTQNIDNLSQRAYHPPEQLMSLYGSMFDIMCSEDECTWIERDNFNDPFCISLAPASVDCPPGTSLALLNPYHRVSHIAPVDLPSCPKCSIGIQRPAIVRYGEHLDRNVVTRVDEWLAKGNVDLMLVIGTSATMLPASDYVARARRLGARLVIVRRDAELLTELVKLDPGDFAFGKEVADYLPQLLEPVIGDLSEELERGIVVKAEEILLQHIHCDGASVSINQSYNLAHIYCHYAHCPNIPDRSKCFWHSIAATISELRRFRSSVMVFFACENTRSHSALIAGQLKWSNAAAIILHPALGMKYLETNWESEEQLVWVRDAKMGLVSYFERWYRGPQPREPCDQQLTKVMEGPTVTGKAHEQSEFRLWVRSRMARPASTGSEVERYIRMEPQETENPVDWWLAQQTTFPMLSKLALDILAIPAMSSDCERSFSLAKLSLTSQRLSMSPATLEALQCLKNWTRQSAVKLGAVKWCQGWQGSGLVDLNDGEY